MGITITGVEDSIKHGEVKDKHVDVYENDRIEFGTSTKYDDMVMLRMFEADVHTQVNLSVKRAKELGNALLSLTEAMENK